MGRGKITGVNNSTSTTGVTTTVSATGSSGTGSQVMTTPAGQVLTGTLVDNQSGATVNFEQSLGAEIGIAVDAKVQYQTVTVGGQVIANVVKLVHRGEIVSVNTTNNGGILLDKASNTNIIFQQQYCNESGIAAGVKVNFERVINSATGAFTAVALEVVG